MAENITLNNVATFQNDTTAVNTVNNNNSAIVTAFADVLSRSGVGPNQMTSSLDMNNNQIINLPPPSTINSPARLIDVVTPGSITISTATTGTSGHVVPFLDGANTWSATQTINPPAGLNQGLVINQTASGTTGNANLNLNSIAITDTVNAGTGTIDGLSVLLSIGSTTVLGPRNGIVGSVQLTSATNAGSLKTYFGVQGVGVSFSADGGTNPNASGTSAGEIQGGNFQAQLGASATSMFATIGLEANTLCLAGSSTWAKALIDLSGAGADAVAGSVINTMIWLNNHTGSVKWTNGILIDNLGGLGSFPIALTGTIIKTSGNGTVANGIDFTNTTFTGNAFLSPGFVVTPTGGIGSGTAGGSSGFLALAGSTSGSANITVNNIANLVSITQPVQVGVIGSTAGSVTLAGQTSGSAVISCSATGSNLQLGAGNMTIDTGGNLITNGIIHIENGAPPVAGGNAGSGLLFNNTAGFGIYTGSGAPTLSAAQGSIYLRTDGATNVTRAYINTTGSTTWTAINTVA